MIYYKTLQDAVINRMVRLINSGEAHDDYFEKNEVATIYFDGFIAEISNVFAEFSNGAFDVLESDCLSKTMIKDFFSDSTDGFIVGEYQDSKALLEAIKKASGGQVLMKGKDLIVGKIITLKDFLFGVNFSMQPQEVKDILEKIFESYIEFENINEAVLTIDYAKCTMLGNNSAAHDAGVGSLDNKVESQPIKAVKPQVMSKKLSKKIEDKNKVEISFSYSAFLLVFFVYILSMLFFLLFVKL